MLAKLAALKKYLVPLGIALGAFVYDVPDSGHVNWRAAFLVGAKAGLTALGITATATAGFVHTAIGAVTKKS